jgi:Ca-activated chloride channel family protein
MMKKNILVFSLALTALLLSGCKTNDDGDYISNNTFPTGRVLTNSAVSGDKFGDFTDNPFVSTASQPVSTFSVDADGASYAIVRKYLRNQYTILPSMVRIEEFLNYFTFNYPAPQDGQAVAINAEVGACPWNSGHYLLRLGIKGKELTDSEMPRANFVFLIDVSGSMQSNDKLPMLKTGLMNLVDLLNPDDRISIITYSGRVKKLIESTPVREADKIKTAIHQLRASGSTDGGEALKMAYEEALTNYDPTANNRIIMGTDGDFNVGVTNTDALVEMVETYAQKGIYMTCLGFGLGNLNDSMMERISNSGNGNYYYIDDEEELVKVFVTERGRFVSVANDAKCQVTFDSRTVSQYRLIGYENRVMESEDFDDDQKDAGEIGAGQTITALYEIVLADGYNKTDGNAPFVTFDFRYKQTLQDASISLQKTLSIYDIFYKTTLSDDFYFAAGVAAYGMLLRQSPYKGQATLEMARELVRIGHFYDPDGSRTGLLNLMGTPPRYNER